MSEPGAERPACPVGLRHAANGLTTLRALLAVPVGLLVLADSPAARLDAALVFGIAAATDFLDGYVARRSGCVSRFGAAWDQLADKLLTSTAIICLTLRSDFPAALAIAFIARDGLIVALRILARRQGAALAATPLAKTKTVLLFVGLGGALLGENLHDSLRASAWGILAVALLLSILSAVQYVVAAAGSLVHAVAVLNAEER